MQIAGLTKSHLFITILMKHLDKTMDVGTRAYTKNLKGPKGKIRTVQTSSKEVSSWFYLGKVGEIGYSIALPIVAGAFIGVYLDRQWSTYPKATLACILLGLAVSVASFIRLVIELIKTP